MKYDFANLMKGIVSACIIIAAVVSAVVFNDARHLGWMIVAGLLAYDID